MRCSGPGWKVTQSTVSGQYLPLPHTIHVWYTVYLHVVDFLIFFWYINAGKHTIHGRYGSTVTWWTQSCCPSIILSTTVSWIFSQGDKKGPEKHDLRRQTASMSFWRTSQLNFEPNLSTQSRRAIRILTGIRQQRNVAGTPGTNRLYGCVRKNFTPQLSKDNPTLQISHQKATQKPSMMKYDISSKMYS